MSKSKIFSFLVAGLFLGLAMFLSSSPAEAGGHEWWRSCGGHTYEGCNGRQYGPYARPTCHVVTICVGYTRYGHPIYRQVQVCR